MNYKITNIKKKQSNTLLIIFTSHGMSKKINKYPFSFFTYFDKLNVNKLFIREKEKCNWYMNGINNEYNNIISCVDYIKTIINENFTNIKKIFTFGLSSGGFAAILFGILLNCQIICASPQTNICLNFEKRLIKNISPLTNYLFNYNLKTKQLTNFEKVNNLKYMDLGLLAKNLNYNKKIYYIVGKYNKQDMYYLRYLTSKINTNNLFIRYLNTNHHKITLFLKKDEFNKIIFNIINR
tara:strand:+ start:29 stop:742 length:714 start_codon:yes stop_codon:yes gene_type:complete